MWDILKSQVSAVVKANGVGAITGDNLQAILKVIIDSLGGTACYKGLAVPSTMPEHPDGPVFYFATQGGLYDGFDGQFIQSGITVLRSVVNAQGAIEWLAEQLLTVADSITDSSNSVASSEVVYKIAANTGVYDIESFDSNKQYIEGTILLYDGRLIKLVRDHQPGELAEDEYELTSILDLLSVMINAVSERIASINSEIITARGGKASLNARLAGIESNKLSFKPQDLAEIL